VFKPQPSDRRVTPRTPANARGVVIAPGIELACVIADTSDGGLRLRLDRAIVLPVRVTVVEVAAGLAIEAETAWRQGAETGLRRKGGASLRGLVPSRLLAAREAWLRAGGR
jgi:hypothetical protein